MYERKTFVEKRMICGIKTTKSFNPAYRQAGAEVAEVLRRERREENA
jgi:hypothetical protein